MLSEDESAARSAYDRLAADYGEAFPDLSAETPGDRSLLHAFAARVDPSGPVLDVGCGTGRVAAHLTGLGLTPIGVDVSWGMLAQARERHPGLPLALGSVTRLPIATASVAGVLAWYSLIHTAPDALPVAVAELSRVLEAGAPTLLAFQSGEGERLERTSAFGHRVRRINYRHEVDHVRDVLAGNGIRVIECVVREPAAAHETTPQAVLLGVRRPGARSPEP